MSAPSLVLSTEFQEKTNANLHIKVDGSYLNVRRHNRSNSLIVNGKSFDVTNFHKSSTISYLPTYETKCRSCKKNYLSSVGSKESMNLTLSQSCVYYPEDTKVSTIRQHYYPEGGWGWIICACATTVQCIIGGLYFSYSFLLLPIRHQFNGVNIVGAVILGATSTSISLLISPVIAILCQKKSTRLIAILGGLVTTLGYLFTSFASQFHQLYFSYGIVIGFGISMIRDTSTIMIGQYFKKKREVIEIITFAGMGIGIALMPIFQTESISRTSWRVGFSIISGIMTITCLLGIFYRSASLYHPQRRAILHLRTIQETACNRLKNNNATSFLKYIFVRSSTVRILLLGNSLIAFGSMAPFYILNLDLEKKKLSLENKYLVQIFIGIASIFGSSLFGLIVVRNSTQCMISRQYLCQTASLMISLAFLAVSVLEDFHGFMLFSCFYGFFFGGYYYSIKMFTLEKVRARNFARVWGIVQWCQALPNVIGISTTAYLNQRFSRKAGYYFSSGIVFFGTLILFLIDINKSRKSPHNRSISQLLNSHLSFQEFNQNSIYPVKFLHRKSLNSSNCSNLNRHDLNSLSEDLRINRYHSDILLDCISSCNKEEKYLMLSEYENNLKKVQDHSEKKCFTEVIVEPPSDELN